MNSTRTLAIVAVLTAATLVVGGTSAAMTTGHSAFAWKQDSYKNKRGDDSYKKVIQADGNYGNGNTNTAQVLKQNAKADKFSIVEQNGENSICTHPSETCTSQSNQPPNQSLSTLSRGVGGMVTAGVSPGPSPSTGSPSSPSTLSLSPSPFLVPGVAAPGPSGGIGAGSSGPGIPGGGAPGAGSSGPGR